ncbi:MGMT family protein [Pseudomonas juntendi]|uniref:MGMT family protein n=1 Tax=Pseudomonas juntendi TaxID=2666183 RepID=A0A7W2LLB0_9PSED|nr:MGMT family protein [Pseudomonas juntendi]NOY04663.1 MGMT family protein [Gammaproteobacteria bacterium]NPA20582.1 MGMT family protein [Gammaproteobacteria bacterium]PPB17971.1 hypothetical protein HV87_26700 [Pseudomonas aeruginosa]QEQ89191.1 MGMT family protein [Pseudomonas putida]
MLAMVPYGTVTSYGQLAKSMGKLTLPEPSAWPMRSTRFRSSCPATA